MRWAVVFLWLVGGLVIWWPPPVVHIRLRQIDIGRDLVLSYPQRLYPGESGRVKLDVQPAESSQSQSAVQSAAIEARLELPGLVGESEVEGQVIAAGRHGEFRWELGSDAAGAYSGRLWVYIGEERTPVLARQVSIVIGGPRIEIVWLVRFLVIPGLLLSVIIALPKFVIESFRSKTIR